MPTATIKDLLDSKDSTVSWSPIRATVKRAPKDVVRSNTANGEWVRATLTITDGTGEIDLVLTDPYEPYLSNPKALEEKVIQIEQGAKKDSYKDKARLKTYGKHVTVLTDALSSTPPSVPGATSAPPAPIPSVPPGQAYNPPTMAPQLTDRAMLEAYAAWGPRLWAILDPSLQAAPGTAQAVAACINTLTIAATSGKILVTLFAEPEEAGE